MTEQCFIDNGDEMTNLTSLFKSLKFLCQDHCLVGATLDYEMFPVMKRSTKDRLYEEASSKGIHGRQMYSILDVREIIQLDDENKNVKNVRLVRVKYPWAGSIEWKGACSDFDKAFWNAGTKSAFKTRNKIDED